MLDVICETGFYLDSNSNVIYYPNWAEPDTPLFKYLDSYMCVNLWLGVYCDGVCDCKTEIDSCVQCLHYYVSELKSGSIVIL